jgi:hypothetical protein
MTMTSNSGDVATPCNYYDAMIPLADVNETNINTQLMASRSGGAGLYY